MRARKSHGRLGRAGFLHTTMAVAIPVVGFFALGIYLGVSAVHEQKESVELAQLQSLTAQSRLLGESLSNSLEIIRAQATTLYQVRSSGNRNETVMPTAPLLHWALLNVDQNTGKTVTVVQKARNPGFKPASIGSEQTFEETYLAQLSRQLDLRQLKQAGVSAVRVKRDPHASSEWLALGFPVVAASSSQLSVVVALVDPVEAFTAFKRFASRSEGGSLRAYLVADDGLILAHSQPTYVSGNFGHAKIFQEALGPMLQGSRLSGAGTYSSIDQQPVVAAYLRPNGLPLGIVVERIKASTGGTLGQFGGGFGAWQRIAGTILASLGGMIVVLLGFTWFLRSRLLVAESGEPEFGKMLEANMLQEFQVEASSPVASALADMAALKAQQEQHHSTESSLRRELMTAESALARIREENTVVNRFEMEAASLRDPKAVARRMTAAATQLCESPTLFFTYHEGVRTAVLHADAGFRPDEAPTGMSFPIDDSVGSRIAQCQQRGEVATVADYPPLAKIVMAQTGVAHFEAWAITGYGHLGRLARKPRLLGILVILKAGSQSVSRNESLGRMVRSTGLIYENALLAQ